MECIAPYEISEEQLLAYSDGEADETTLKHIARCAYCTEQARAITANQSILRVLFQRIECPDAHTLGEFHLGLLSPDEHPVIEDHVNSCPDCSKEISDLEQFLQEVPIKSTPHPLQTQLKRLVARPAPSPPDPAAQQPAFVFRGAAAAPLDVYQAEDIKMVVGLEADGIRAGRKMLLGFTTRENKPIESLSGAQVQLSRRGQAIAREQVDTLGNFIFSDLTSGEYELTLFTDQEQIVIETIII